MKYSYVARQPILDSEKNTVAYELLFRDGPQNTFPAVEAQQATNRLLVEQFLSTQHNGFGKKRSYVNFPYQSLLDQIPELFPSTSIVVEVLEDCEPDDDLFEAIKALYNKGYTIALDDFIPSQEWQRFLPYIAIIKIDIREFPLEKAARLIQKLSKSKIQFLAEKVETYEEYQQAQKAGFTLFQGYFFARPEVLQHKDIRPSLLTVVQLCKEIAKDEIDYRAIEQIFTGDVSLSYKLLRSVNSTAMVRQEIKSFRQALVYLGEERLKKFVSLVAVSSTTEGKPNCLYTLSVARARFCELLTKGSNCKCDPGQAFLTGMFSLLDSMLDQPLEEIVASIPVDHSIKDALLDNEGELGELITLVRAFEKAKWETVIRLRKKLGINEDYLADCYQQSNSWSAELMDFKK